MYDPFLRSCKALNVSFKRGLKTVCDDLQKLCLEGSNISLVYFQKKLQVWIDAELQSTGKPLDQRLKDGKLSDANLNRT